MIITPTPWVDVQTGDVLLGRDGRYYLIVLKVESLAYLHTGHRCAVPDDAVLPIVRVDEAADLARATFNIFKAFPETEALA